VRDYGQLQEHLDRQSNIICDFVLDVEKSLEC